MRGTSWRALGPAARGVRSAAAAALALAATMATRPASAQYPPQPPYGQPPAPYGQPPAPYGQPPYGQPPGYGQPPPYVSTHKRDNGEMAYLYGTSIAYGLGTGIWIDALAGVKDPGIAFIAPLAFAAAAPVGVFLWDNADTFRRGVPASIATGMLLGGVEGIGISGVQWQYAGNGGNDTWSFKTQSTVTFLSSTVGGVGGYIFGTALEPDPRSLGFIASGGGWGALVGTLFGAGVTPRRDDPSRADWKDSASVAGLIGYNAGIVATGALSAFYVPSWKAQKAMWYGFLGGTAAASFVYVFYLFSDSPPWHGLIANAVGGLAGIGIGAALMGNSQDDDATVQRRAFAPPFQLGLSPLARGGAVLNAHGTF